MFNHSILRPLIGLPLAAVIVFGLFSFMRTMIDQDFVPPEATPQRVIEILTPPDLEDPDAPPIRPPVQKLDVADKPPPPPKLSSSASSINLPMPVLRGATPDLAPVGPVKALALAPIAIDERDAVPVRKPIPTYPRPMAERGLEGSCAVYLNVDPRGTPYDVRAVCTHEGFADAAERAVKRSEFAPKIFRGQPVAREGVVYPIEFRLDG